MYKQIKNYVLSMMSIVGVNPLNNNYISKLINVLILTITTFTCVLLCLNVYYEEFSMRFINDLVESLSALFQYIIKQLPLLINSSVLTSLFNDVDAFWLTTVTSDTKCRRECDAYLKLIERFIKAFRWYTLCCMLYYAVVPFFTGTLIMPVYQPDFLPKTVFYIQNGLTFVLHGTTAVTFDVVAFYFIAVAHVQFKLLNSRIRNLNLLKTEKECKREIAELVEHQNFLYKNVEKINVVCAYTFLTDLVLGTLLFWFQIFMVTGKSNFDNDVVNQIKRVSFSSALILQFCLYCLPASLVDEDNEQLVTSMYTSNWYDCKNESIKKSLIIMMQRAQKKAEVTAGYLIPLNMETLPLVLRHGFSFYTMLTIIEDNFLN